MGNAEGLLPAEIPGEGGPPSQVSSRNERQKGLVPGQLPVPTRVAQPLAAPVESQLQQLGWGLCPRGLSSTLPHTPLSKGAGEPGTLPTCACAWN